ncbi:integrase [Gemmobacter aquaticus]|uniref:Integrase n=2 Tax=Gemmobacter aquaticus TaxID=490185 RepID=A0A917YQY6_9RHOB|nr:tyrosine-type recombinase/integrase [Gemmobacter aquaticus]GGO39300.1 integrase [Gemmobacter aquaticus]
MAIMRRGKGLSLRRRVPNRYASIEPRREIWLSLHTDSETIARQKESRVWQEQIEAWEARLAGDTAEAEARHAAARRLAEVRGYRYLSSADVAQLPRAELLDRIEGVAKRGVDPKEAAALLGGVKEPVISVTGALEVFWDLARDQVLGKSPDQERRWRNPRIKAVRNFVDVIGDKSLSEISRDDLIAFRSWWLNRLEEEGLSADSAMKDITHLTGVLRKVIEMRQLKVDLSLGGLGIKSREGAKRLPFSDGWIRDRLLAPGALDGMNDQERCILMVVINTGARLSEVAGLRAEEICLDHSVPHLSFQPIGRQLKSSNASRSIPLLGIALDAMRQFPEGFPRYRENSASLSAAMNKFLRSNALMETPRHTIYSLRHAFEDRMLAARIDERIRRDLMGHALARERYGLGASLAHAAELLVPISF